MRNYNLCRTFPPDVNFLKIEGMELSKEATALGFPIEHRHKLSCLRQELIGEILLNLLFGNFLIETESELTLMR